MCIRDRFYPSSQLGDKAATFEGLKAGTIEMTECAATDLSAFNDMWSVFSLPYLWEDGSQAVNTVMDDEVKAVLEMCIRDRYTAAGTMLSTTLRIPRMYYYVSIPIGFALMIYEYLRTIKSRTVDDPATEQE